MSGNIPRSLKSSTIAIRMLKLRARRSSFHAMRVSPSCNVLRQRRREGWFVVGSGSLVLNNFLATGALQGGALVK
jgi:hypothetical protein